MMSGGENDFKPHVSPVRGREYTAESGGRHRSVNGSRRFLFFGLASIWGFSVGVAGLLAAMSAAGQPLQPRSGAILGLIPAFVLAAAGGAVMAAAYKDSKRRAR